MPMQFDMLLSHSKALDGLVLVGFMMLGQQKLNLLLGHAA